MSVPERFRTLLGWLEPSPREKDVLAVHRDTITKCLKGAFGEIRVEPIGSYSRRTAVSGQSDLDLMAYLSGDEARWGGRLVNSDRLLTKVRGALQERYTSTLIGKDAQAVVVSFGGGDRLVDVVPAFWVGMVESAALERKRPLFKIPNGSGGWFDTSPQAHKTYIESEDERAGGRLRRTAQLIKFWGACRGNVVLTSFHVEVLLAQSEICRAPGGYAQYLEEFFGMLASRGCRALQDPLGISGYIPAARTAAQIGESLSAVETTLALARRARREELGRNSLGAYELWNRVFNGQFPSR